MELEEHNNHRSWHLYVGARPFLRRRAAGIIEVFVSEGTKNAVVGEYNSRFSIFGDANWGKGYNEMGFILSSMRYHSIFPRSEFDFPPNPGLSERGLE